MNNKVKIMTEQFVRAENIRASLSLAACNSLRCIFIGRGFSVIIIFAGVKWQAASLRLLRLLPLSSSVVPLQGCGKG
jgi:hypothetical protein